MIRSEAQREAWRKLSPYHRFLIMAERPDDLEHEQSLRSDTLYGLESEFGPRQWDATVAILSEGEAEEVDYMTYADGEPDGMTFGEIGEELGLSRERVRQMILQALRKMSEHPVIRELRFASRPGLMATAEDIDAAIERALAATEDKAEER